MNEILKLFVYFMADCNDLSELIDEAKKHNKAMNILGLSFDVSGSLK